MGKIWNSKECSVQNDITVDFITWFDATVDCVIMEDNALFVKRVVVSLDIEVTTYFHNQIVTLTLRSHATMIFVVRL